MEFLGNTLIIGGSLAGTIFLGEYLKLPCIINRFNNFTSKNHSDNFNFEREYDINLTFEGETYKLEPMKPQYRSSKIVFIPFNLLYLQCAKTTRAATMRIRNCECSSLHFFFHFMVLLWS